MVANLLIPSAKYISKELQSIGKIPPILYPLGSGIVLDYLYAQYITNVNSIKIVGFEGFQLLKEKLNTQTYSKITLVRLESLDDLAHTVYGGLSDSEEEVIINFGDTFVDENCDKLERDSFYYSRESYSEDWTFFNVTDGKLTKIIDKPSNTVNSV